MEFDEDGELVEKSSKPKAAPADDAETTEASDSDPDA